MNALSNAIRRLIEKGEHSVPLAAFRIVFSLALLGEAFQLLRFRNLFFDSIPYMEPSRLSAGMLLIFWLIALVCLLVGFRTREAAVASYVMAVVVLGVSAVKSGFGYHADSFYIAGSLFLVIAPAGRTLSVDAWLECRRGDPPPEEVSSLYRLTLMLILAIVYLDSFTWKITSPMWTAGLGVWTPAMHPAFPARDLSSILDREWLARLLGYAVLVFEGAFPLLVWFRPFTVPMLVAGILLHIGIGVVFPAPLFSLVVIAFYVGCTPPEMLTRLFRFTRHRDTTTTASLDRWEALPAAAMIAVVIATSILVTIHSPLWNVRMLWTEQPHPLKRLYYFASAAAFAFTGAQPHGVFHDTYFNRRRHVLMLMWSDDRGQRALPLTQSNGLATGRYLSGRIYSMWTWPVELPRQKIDPEQREILRFAAFWAMREGVDLERGHLKILARPIGMSLLQWRPGWMAHNRRLPWSEVGRVVRDRGGVSVEWSRDAQR